MISDQSAMDESITRMQAMRCQEESVYAVEDYFKSITTSLDSIDSECRLKMGNWSYQVIDFCKYNRETAQIAMSYLDRYLLTQEGKCALHDRSQYQLVCMTTMYIAAKIHESEVIDPFLVSALSRGSYSEDTIVQMEQKVLAAIKWRVNPPTSMSFYREFICMLPKEIQDIVNVNDVLTLVQAQIDYALFEHDFMTVKASMLAFCSFINAIKCLVGNEVIVSTLDNFLSKTLSIDCNSDEVIQVKQTLNDTVIQQYIHKMKRNDSLYSKDTRPVVGRTFSPQRINDL